VFMMPVLALGAGSVWHRVSSGAKAIVAVWTAGLVIHTLVWPYRLFHLFNGEAPLGEWLSQAYGSDFSRLVPSFIRINTAAWVAIPVVVFVVVLGLRRARIDLAVPAVSLAIAAVFSVGRQPAPVVHFEDAHVRKKGGELYPEQWAAIRWFWPGGWVLHSGNSLSFLATEGTHALYARSGVGGAFELDGRTYEIAPSDAEQRVVVRIGRSGRTTLLCVRGAVFVDRMVHE
jgi:hypothetical protein